MDPILKKKFIHLMIYILITIGSVFFGFFLSWCIVKLTPASHDLYLGLRNTFLGMFIFILLGQIILFWLLRKSWILISILIGIVSLLDILVMIVFFH
jgi:hypothetical protein